MKGNKKTPAPERKGDKEKKQEKEKDREKDKKNENMVLITNSVGNGLWCRVKGTPTADSIKKPKADISDIERKAEKSVIDMLEIKIKQLNNELESISMDKQQIEFESGIAIKERDILKQQHAKLVTDYNQICEKSKQSEEDMANIKAETKEYSSKYERTQQDHINAQTELSKLRTMVSELQAQKIDQAKRSQDIINKLQEQLEDYSEQTEKLEEEVKALQENGKPEAKSVIVPSMDKPDISKPPPTATKENNDGNSKMNELVNDALTLKKKLKAETDARRQMQEHIKIKEGTIKTLTDQAKQLSEQIASMKSSLSYTQSQLTQKIADNKLVEGKLKILQQKLNEVEKERDKEKAKLKSAAAEDSLEDSIELVKVEAQPYLFGPGT